MGKPKVIYKLSLIIFTIMFAIISTHTATAQVPFIRNGSAAGTGAIYGVNSHATGMGVRGFAISATGATRGVFGHTLSGSNGASGVFGYASSTGAGVTYGVWGLSNSSNGRGVVGMSTKATGAGIGVWGQSAGVTGKGLFGYATSATGVNMGVYGVSISPTGFGVYGIASTLPGPPKVCMALAGARPGLACMV